MVKLDNYNADEVEPAGSFEPLPVGKYMVVIEDSDMKDNNAGTGQYLKLTYNVVDGNFQGRKLFENLNLHFDDAGENEKHATAMKIANGKLRSICFAVGNHTPQDTSELHDIPFVVTVGIQKSKSEAYPEPQNVIRKYEPLNQEATPIITLPGKEAPDKKQAVKGVGEEKKSPAAAGTTGKKKPWQKK